METTDDTKKLQSLQCSSFDPSHSKILLQSTLVPWSFMPPLSPNQNSKNSSSVGKTNVPSQSPLLGKNYLKASSFKANEGLPPRRGHRRSNSDVPLGFSAMIQSSPQLIPISGHNFLGDLGVKQEVDLEDNGVENPSEIVKFLDLDSLEDKDSVTNVHGGEISDNEEESSVTGKGNEVLNGVKLNLSLEKREIGVKRNNVGVEIGPITRHLRSISMDSFMEDLDLDDAPRKLNSTRARIRQQSPISSMDENSLKFSLEFGNGEFTEEEMKKITANDKLAEIALSDPKRAKRILANRQSAARSKERKMRYISELEVKVQNLQTEITTLSSQMALLQRETSDLSGQNSELKFRLKAMEQQGQLKDALNEALNAEVQRLKVAGTDFRGEIRPSMAWLGTIG